MLGFMFQFQAMRPTAVWAATQQYNAYTTLHKKKMSIFTFTVDNNEQNSGLGHDWE